MYSRKLHTASFTVLMTVKSVKVPIASSIPEGRALILFLIIKPFEYIISAGPIIFFQETHICGWGWGEREREVSKNALIIGCNMNTAVFMDTDDLLFMTRLVTFNSHTKSVVVAITPAIPEG